SPLHHDDWLDSFYLQSTTQIDGLRHIGYPGLGFYGGAQAGEFGEKNTRLGIQHWAERPFVGRGILLDVAGYLACQGRPIDPRTAYQITVEDLEATAKTQGTAFLDGDILLVRTGFAEYCRTGMSEEDRRVFKADMRVPGLASTQAIVAWLWDRHFALIAADNLGVEAYPYTAANDVTLPVSPKPEKGPDHNGGLHRPLIPLLGFALGEMFDLEALAADCALDGRYEFFFSAKPLNLTGGVGSPANALAIK
ncbi:MAG: cyclase family protein, partial [Propionibacteriaceae bacterium]|nr:cyclase family protein [Propionibacteriaceae bacterium]